MTVDEMEIDMEVDDVQELVEWKELLKLKVQCFANRMANWLGRVN